MITSQTWHSHPRPSRKRNVEQCTDIELYPTNTYQKINGAHWSTFCHFGSYEEAHAQALRKSSDGSRGQQIAAEEAKGSREQNIEATHKNTHTHRCRGKAKVPPHMTTQRAESGGQRAKGMHWAHGKLQECKKLLQQITQEGTETHQMSETKRR